MGDEVIIVGAGIGGLTLGLALHQAESPAAFSSARPRSRRSASASTCCRMRRKELAALGLEPALAKAAITTTDATFFNRFGQLIYQEPLGRAAGYEHPQFSIHRGDLQMILLDAFVARAGADGSSTGRHCAGVEQDEAGVTVTFSGRRCYRPRAAASRSPATASTPRSASSFIPDEGEPRYSGVNMWRGVTRWKPMLSGASMVRAGWLRMARW